MNINDNKEVKAEEIVLAETNKVRKPSITDDKLTTLIETKFINLYDYPFKENGHYLTASRRKRDNLVMFKSDEEYKKMVSDAVTIVTILKVKGEEPRLLLNREFRYATARFIIAPPAGIIDPEDKDDDNPLICAAIREVYEEAGITVKDTDKIFVVNPLLFSSPGMTDESNGIVCAVIERDNYEELNHDSLVGSEVMDGFLLLTKDEARKIIEKGTDEDGFFYSVYTFVALMYFVSDMWAR